MELKVTDVADSLAIVIFGPESITRVGPLNIIHPVIKIVVESLAVAGWDTRGRQWKRARASTLRLEGKLIDDVTSTLQLASPRAQADTSLGLGVPSASPPTPSEVARLIQRINGTISKAKLFGDEEMVARVATWKESLEQMHDVASKVKGAKQDRTCAVSMFGVELTSFRQVFLLRSSRH